MLRPQMDPSSVTLVAMPGVATRPFHNDTVTPTVDKVIVSSRDGTFTGTNSWPVVGNVFFQTGDIDVDEALPLFEFITEVTTNCDVSPAWNGPIQMDMEEVRSVTTLPTKDYVFSNGCAPPDKSAVFFGYRPDEPAAGDPVGVVRVRCVGTSMVYDIVYESTYDDTGVGTPDQAALALMSGTANNVTVISGLNENNKIITSYTNVVEWTSTPSQTLLNSDGTADVLASGSNGPGTFAFVICNTSLTPILLNTATPSAQQVAPADVLMAFYVDNVGFVTINNEQTEIRVNTTSNASDAWTTYAVTGAPRTDVQGAVWSDSRYVIGSSNGLELYSINLSTLGDNTAFDIEFTNDTALLTAHQSNVAGVYIGVSTTGTFVAMTRNGNTLDVANGPYALRDAHASNTATFSSSVTGAGFVRNDGVVFGGVGTTVEKTVIASEDEGQSSDNWTPELIAVVTFVGVIVVAAIAYAFYANWDKIKASTAK
ncbi:MAG: hypothetical protein CMK92_04095, partial [Pseudomonas sp.]|nr:hypothetical protein [Pseudomonas sp.]